MSDATTNGVEQSVELADLMAGFSEALAATTVAMDNAFTTHPDLKDKPVVYQIPKMNVEVKMTMVFTNGKIRGMFWNKEKSEQSKEVSSTIRMDFVAVPRQAGMQGWRDLSHTVPMTSGMDVKILQLKLQEYARVKGLKLHLLLDGIFGTQTEESVMEFQKREGLVPTGKVDAKTYKKLCEIVKDPAPIE